MGAKAIAALKKFQSDHGLPVTGLLDRKTLDTLGAGNTDAKSSTPAASTATPAPAIPLIQKFVPPESEGDAGEFLKALQAVSDDYKTYEVSGARSEIEAREMSVTVVNDLKTLGHAEGGTFYFDTLTEESRAQFQSNILLSNTNYLRKKCRVTDQARIKLMVMIYDKRSMHFDNNGYPWAVVGVRLLLLDTQDKKILWYTNKAWGLGNDVKGASEFASGSINLQLDHLFGVGNTSTN
jgi:hypothetical protein